MSDKTKKKLSQKPVKEKEYCSFLYMLSDMINAGQIAEALSLDKKAVELWMEANILEITLTNGTLTFEDMMEEMNGAKDAALLTELKIKQVYACDYEAADRDEVKRIFQGLTEQFGGRLASDTEDFKPFLEVAEL